MVSKPPHLEVGQLWSENEIYVWEIMAVHGDQEATIKVYKHLGDDYDHVWEIGDQIDWGGFNSGGWKLYGPVSIIDWEIIYVESQDPAS